MFLITAPDKKAPNMPSRNEPCPCGSNVTEDPKVPMQIAEFLSSYQIKKTVFVEGNMGCPHEEGEDFPVGEDCPFCPFWAGKQGSKSEPF